MLGRPLVVTLLVGFEFGLSLVEAGDGAAVVASAAGEPPEPRVANQVRLPLAA